MVRSWPRQQKCYFLILKNQGDYLIIESENSRGQDKIRGTLFDYKLESSSRARPYLYVKVEITEKVITSKKGGNY